jgi:hypothetical protein
MEVTPLLLPDDEYDVETVKWCSLSCGWLERGLEVDEDLSSQAVLLSV